MAVFQCSCGMLVSSPELRIRCLRCGRILGADEELHDLFGAELGMVHVLQGRGEPPVALDQLVSGSSAHDASGSS